MNTVSGIYMITCKITGKSYIGKTIGKIRQRVMYHLNGNTPGCVALHSAIKKYGKENFTWEVLHENVIPELLSAFEMEAIQIYNTLSPAGYNLTRGGETGFHSEETVRKRTETLRANPPMKGKNHTPEARRKMSESRTGLKRTKEQRLNISKSLMGHEVSPDTRTKIGNANRGNKWSDEARQEMSKRNSGEDNPMYGVKRRGTDSPNISPKYIPARDYFHSLPPDMPMKEKRSHLRSKFPNLTPKCVERWTLKWIRSPHLETGGDNPHYNPNHTGSDTQSLPEKEPAREFFFSLPSDMDIKEKRQSLYTKFPNVKQSTIAEWIRKWTNYKPYREESRHSAEYHRVHDLYLSLPSEMSVVEKRRFLQNHFKDIQNGKISRWVKQWTNTVGRQPTHSDYERAKALFVSMTSDIRLNERCQLVGEKLPNINRNTLTKWIKIWTGETMPTGSPCHPERPLIHEYFLSLPLNMPISEKRKLILEKFDDTVRRSLVNRWTRQWHIELTGSPPPVEKWYREPCNHWKKGKPAHNRRPEYDDAQEFFFSLSPMMPSREKSKQLFVKYPHIPKGTIYQWVSRWQSEQAS